MTGYHGSGAPRGPISSRSRGLTTGYDHVAVRGSPADGSFSIVATNRIISSASNRSIAPADHVFGRRLLTSNRSVMPEQAMDTSFDLKSVLA